MLYQEMSYTCDIMYLFLQLGPGRPTGGFDHAALFPRSKTGGSSQRQQHEAGSDVYPVLRSPSQNTGD